MVDSLAQLALAVDSLRMDATRTAYIVPKDYALAGAAIISAITALYSTWQAHRFHRINKRDEKMRVDQSYAALWGAVLGELYHALGRMRTHAEAWLADHSRLNRLEVVVTSELRNAFLLSSRHPAVSYRIISLYDNITHYRDSYRVAVEYSKRRNEVDSRGGALDFMKQVQTLDQNMDEWAQSAIWITIHRHAGMVEEFAYCVGEYEAFLKITGQPVTDLPSIPEALAVDLRKDESALQPR